MRASTGPHSDCCLFLGVDKVGKDGVVKSLFLAMRQSVQNILLMARRRLSTLYLPQWRTGIQSAVLWT